MRQGMRAVFAAALLAALLVVPANALAAPANDDFASREPLSGSLPIEVTRSNVGATKESGEDISTYAAGHSVWFEWEAAATGWVSIGACDSDFAALVGVFAGTELTHLTKVASGNSAEGPKCHGTEREFTFKALSGTKYEIAVDGNAFTPNPEFTPDTEGEATLRIEPTPPPPNDSFAHAADLTAAGEIYEFEAENRFYFARLDGYNWNASKEAGEPEHEGNPGGASVWYRWTAPATGLVHLSACCFANPLVGIYTGTTVDSLIPVPFSAEIWPEKQAQVIAGQTYMIAVDGVFDGSSGEAAQVSFSINASMNVPALPKEAPGSAPVVSSNAPSDTVAPETTIDKTALRAATRSAKFWFSASEPAQGFLCRLDKGDFKPCGSPRTYKHLKPGRHAFRVKAVDAAGNVDGTAAVAAFRVPRPKKRR
ncbi:MAG TPA: hypothetical protein VFP17_09195 [Solirubrobacterales bacterium]|nr:hypothetical protein [Solirubrobacterales bacterium]